MEGSPERRSDNPRSSPDEDEKALALATTQVRLLVSNTAAGCVIGKGGSTINEIQAESGARVQLSRSHEFFPGTPDRIILLSGFLPDIVRGLELILGKLLDEAEEGSEVDGRSKVRLVVPNSSCGGIIGKGGSTIKSFIEESNAGIKISPQDNNYTGVHDRLVTISGPFDKQMRAIELVLGKLMEDPHYPHNLNSPFPYSGYHAPMGGYMAPPSPYNSSPNYGPNGQGDRRYKGNNAPRSPAPSHEIGGESKTLAVPDEHIGAVVGRSGRTITEIIQLSGARIKISDRGDFMPGTSDRKVTITGTPEAIRTAEAMVMQRVSQSSERENN